MSYLSIIPSQLSKPWLVTGGAGFIGGHVIEALTEARIPSVCLDIDTISAEQKFSNQVQFENCDIRDKEALTKVFANQNFEGVIHLAALKSVEQSQHMRKEYFETNVRGTQNILEVMQESDTRKIIFSSSAAVYEAKVGSEMVDESSPLKPLSYYGQTKADAEDLILKFTNRSLVSSIIFRYFNVAGSRNSRLKDNSIQNLIPITINRLKNGLEPEIFGDDYETPDGTAVRDYVDVRDLASAHLKAIDYLSRNSNSHVLNLGTGYGASVKDVIALAQEILGTSVSPIIRERRSGDISAITADCKKAKDIIDFTARFNLREMIETSV